VDESRKRAAAHFEQWYDALPTYAASGGGPARGTIAAALVVLERLKEKCDLNLDAHRARGKAQIQGISPGTVQRILERFGETRPFLKEGGRTNRGGPGDIETMLQALGEADLSSLSPDTRISILDYLQGLLAEKVREYHSRERLKPVYDASQSTRQFVHEVLVRAEETGRRGPVAQHLVGAKLEMRFPDQPIRIEAVSAADDQAGQAGDFQVGDTVFHVTVAPSSGHNSPIWKPKAA